MQIWLLYEDHGKYSDVVGIYTNSVDANQAARNLAVTDPDKPVHIDWEVVSWNLEKQQEGPFICYKRCPLVVFQDNINYRNLPYVRLQLASTTQGLWLLKEEDIP